MDWAEDKQEELDNDLFGHLLDNERATLDFLVFLSVKEPKLVEKLLDEWCKTHDGKKWYENTLDNLISDFPEMEIEDIPGSER